MRVQTRPANRPRPCRTCVVDHWNHRGGTLILYGHSLSNIVHRGVNVGSGASHSARRSVLRAGVGLRRHSAPRHDDDARARAPRTRRHRLHHRCAGRALAHFPVARIEHGVDVRIFPNVSNRLAYHLQFFTPIGLRAYLRTAAASVRHRPPARVPQPARHHCGGGIDACGGAVCRFAERHGTPDRTARARQARVRGDRREAHPQPARRGCLRSRDIEREQLASLGVPRSRIAVVPNPVEDASVADADAARFRGDRMTLVDRRLVLFLGKLTPRKGVEDLVRAFGTARSAERGARNRRQRHGLRPRRPPAGEHTGARRTGRSAPDFSRRPNAWTRSPPRTWSSIRRVTKSSDWCLLKHCNAAPQLSSADDSGCGEVIRQVGGGLIVPPGDPAALSAAVRVHPRSAGGVATSRRKGARHGSRALRRRRGLQCNSRPCIATVCGPGAAGERKLA